MLETVQAYAAKGNVNCLMLILIIKILVHFPSRCNPVDMTRVHTLSAHELSSVEI